MLFSFSARSTMYWTCSFVRIKWQLHLPPYKGANHIKGIYETLLQPGLSIPLIPWNRQNQQNDLQRADLDQAEHPPCLFRVHCPPEETLGPWLLTEYSAKTDQNGRYAQADLRLRRAHVSFCLFCLALAELLCFSVAQNQNRHSLRSLFSKIVFVPLFPSFSDLTSLVPLK